MGGHFCHTKRFYVRRTFRRNTLSQAILHHTAHTRVYRTGAILEEEKRGLRCSTLMKRLDFHLVLNVCFNGRRIIIYSIQHGRCTLTRIKDNLEVLLMVLYAVLCARKRGTNNALSSGAPGTLCQIYWCVILFGLA